MKIVIVIWKIMKNNKMKMNNKILMCNENNNNENNINVIMKY